MGSRGAVLFAIFASYVAILPSNNLRAQSIYATLTGVVSDPAQAVVPDATVKLKNEQSGSLRETTTNGEGYFTFASVAVGNFTYELSVESKGFTSFQDHGHFARRRREAQRRRGLTVGTTSQTVEITGNADQGSRRWIPARNRPPDHQGTPNYVQTGSNAAEFIKIMPDSGISTAGRTRRTVTAVRLSGSTSNGDAGSQSPLNGAYSYNGLPGNSLDITADGAHTSDPGL